MKPFFGDSIKRASSGLFIKNIKQTLIVPYFLTKI